MNNCFVRVNESSKAEHKIRSNIWWPFVRLGHFSELLGQYVFIVHAGLTYRPGIYAFHSVHTCSNSSNTSSNWHDRRDKKLSFTEVSFSSDSCLKVGTYTASKLCDYLFFYR